MNNWVRSFLQEIDRIEAFYTKMHGAYKEEYT